MSILQPPRPAKLVIGSFSPDKGSFSQTAELLTAEFGEIDIVSSWFPFDYTNYYTDEMGGPLFRRMISFAQLIEQDRLADIKHVTHRIEQKFTSDGGRRTVNIDPGYLLRERFVLATGKNYSHRIYLGKSIYADLTLIFSGGAYRPLPWTYPDYAAGDMQAFLVRVRKKYIHDSACAGTCGTLSDRGKEKPC